MTPLAYSYNFPKFKKEIPFNKEIIRLVKKWEQYHHVKFFGKILPTKGQFAFFDYKNIHIPFCDRHTLFHELQHVMQQKKGCHVKRFTINYLYHLYPKYKNIDFYFQLPTERDANRTAKRLNSILK